MRLNITTSPAGSKIYLHHSKSVQQLLRQTGTRAAGIQNAMPVSVFLTLVKDFQLLHAVKLREKSITLKKRRKERKRKEV